MSTKLSQKLERINASMARIREKTNLPNAVIEDVATAVEQLGTSGGETTKTNIYKVATIEERDAITDMVEGDMCVVHMSSLANMKATDSVTAITFPATVVLPSAFTGNTWVSLRDSGRRTDVMIDLSQTMMRCDVLGTDYISISYTSTDGITYTRTDTQAETIEFSSPVSCAYADEWDDTIGYFLQVGGVTFDGIFEYKDNNWVYANIGLEIKQNEVLKGTTVYSTAGFLKGSLAEDSNTDTVANVNSIMNSMSNITLPSDCSRFLAKSQLQNSEYLPITKVLNTSGVTKMYYMISDFPNLKELDISNFNTADVTNMEGFLKTNPMLEKINLSNLDTSKVTTMQGLLSGNTSLDNVDISHFNLSSCTSLSGLFYGNSNLTNY
jgi:surface protein